MPHIVPRMKYKGPLGALILLACHGAVAQLSITEDPTLGGLLPAARPAPARLPQSASLRPAVAKRSPRSTPFAARSTT